ncbi:hypothetical protein [Veillonella sp.]
MERVSASLIEEIRSDLIERYNRDQEIQQMIEEIGTEEGLNEKELSIIYQAYLEVKERMQYTANLMELWNQIEIVQDRMDLLNSFESLERDLFGDVLSLDKPMGYGASHNEHLDYAMEQIKLHDVDTELEDIDLAKEYPFEHKNASHNDLEDELEDIEESEDIEEHDDYDEEIDKLIKKQLKRVEEEWAKLSGKNTKKDKKKKDKDKDKKKDKKDKDKKNKKSNKEFDLDKESKKDKKDKESKKNKKDKEFKLDKDSKKNKKDKDKKKEKKSKKDKESKKLEKALKKESKKSGKKD